MLAVSNPSTTEQAAHGTPVRVLALAALGVVFGDIGTSPLYALRECFSPTYGIPLTHDNLLGILSLIFWSLITVISIKYATLMMRADNRGEGGVLALLALLSSRSRKPGRTRTVLLSLGVLGAAAFFADGMLTPAISVLSAIEGLRVISPSMHHTVVPLAAFVLACLFYFQRFGTGRVGSVFGPIMILWFSSLGLMGITLIVRHPSVLQALSPHHAVLFFAHNGIAGFFVLAAVFLTVTGGEALYADMGHFGRVPIRIAWFGLVLPGLTLNYFGQAALLISDPAALRNPFYLLAPGWALVPLLLLATAATVIASQAVISGAFSVTRQALQLGLIPRLGVRHSSATEIGQVYVPTVNRILFIATLVLVVSFGSSESLAGAYGLSVAVTMLIDSTLVFVYARRYWRWALGFTLAAIGPIFMVDSTFVVANLVKILDGAWVPMLVASAVFLMVNTWIRGRELLRAQQRESELPLDVLTTGFGDAVVRVPGTAIFLTSRSDRVPRTLLHNLKHNKVLHEHVVFLNLSTEEVPRVSRGRRVDVDTIAPGFQRVVARYGFMETPDIEEILEDLSAHGVDLDLMDTTFFFSRDRLVFARRSPVARWRRKLFAFLSRNAEPATQHFGVPPNRVVELGAQMEI